MEESRRHPQMKVVEPLARLPLRKTIPIRPRKILKYAGKRLMRVLFWGGLVLAGVLWMIRNDLFPGVPPVMHGTVLIDGSLLLAVLVFVSMIREILHFYTYFYDIEGNNLVVRKGIISKFEVILSFSRITDVYVDQDLGDFLFRLYDIHLSTPTAESGSKAHINGLDKRGAVKLRKLILERINASS